jgi:hypothetical protein
MRLLLIFLCLISCLANAQIEQPSRVEIELGDRDEFFNLVPTRSDELVLFREVESKLSRSTTSTEIVLLDESFHFKVRDTVTITDDFFFIGYDYYDDSFFMLFDAQDPSAKKFLLVEYRFSDRSVKRFELKKPFDIDLSDFDVVEGWAIFQGMVGERPVVFSHGLREEKLAVLPGIYSKNSSLISLKIDRQSKTLNAIVKDRSFRKNIIFSVKTYTLDGQLLRTVVMDPGSDHFLLDAEVSSLDRDRIWISGTYAENRSRYSRGMFIAELSNRGQEYITFINYGDFENFFDYMKERREKRVKNRIKRRKEKGKRIKFNYRVLVHEIVERDNEYLLIGEAYYPRYSHPNYYAGINSTSSDFYFDGYRYTHAVIFSFDKNGNKNWDNCFEINDIVTFTLQQYVSLSTYEDRILLMYEFEDKIHSKIIGGSEVINGKEETELRSRFEDDEIIDTYGSYGGLGHWYEDTFYAFGVQDIKRENQFGGESNRTVFYINKITFTQP